MANTTLTTTVTETVTLNGDTHNKIHRQSFINVNEYITRTVTVTTGTQTLLLTSTASAAGTVILTDIKYLRVTNLDHTNFVTLGLVDTSGDTAYLKLSPRSTFLTTNDDLEANTSGSSFSAFSQWDTLNIKADTASCDVELVVASA